jgi:hypothetical protein
MLTVYFDMDGVLTDYDGQLAFEASVTRELLVADRSFRRAFENARKQRLGPAHYMNIPPNDLEGFRSFIRELSKRYSCEILTSYGDPAPSEGGCAAHEGKVAWLNQHYGDLLRDQIIQRFNGVSSCVQKGFFGRPDAFLIDDQEDNIASFAAKGGGVFHYKMGSDFSEVRAAIQRHGDICER